MKNILFVGLGSIGQRHLRNLKKINKKFNFFAIRKKKTTPLLSNTNKVIKNKFLSKENKIKEIKFSEVKKNNIDTVFITNPSSKHLISAIKFAKLGCNLFIEKPLSHNLNNVNVLKKLIIKKKLLCAVGYQTRYDSLLHRIKKYISNKTFGKICYVNIQHRSYLPFHHQYEDYRIGYAARRDLGGGVLLSFIHEIDYANFLFGKPLELFGTTGKISNLKIDVEDSANFTVIYKLFRNKIPVNFNLDFIKRKPLRFCEIQFEKANLCWDLLNNKIHFRNKKKTTIKSRFKSRNSLFIEELKQVIKSFNMKKQPLSNFDNGEKSLRIVVRLKDSIKKKKWIKYN